MESKACVSVSISFTLKPSLGELLKHYKQHLKVKSNF